MSNLSPYEYILYFYNYNGTTDEFNRLTIPEGIVPPPDTFFECIYPKGYIRINMPSSEIYKYQLTINVRMSLIFPELLGLPLVMRIQHGGGIGNTEIISNGYFYSVIEGGEYVAYTRNTIALRSDFDNTFYVGVKLAADAFTTVNLPKGVWAVVNYKLSLRNL